MRTALVAVGIFVVLYSLYLALAETYNHFYEVTLLGLLFVLLPYVYQKLTPAITFKFYLACVIVAILGDLFIVLGFTHLWYYTYAHLWEYALLYLFIYPAGGFVMLASYLLVKPYFLPRTDRRIDFRIFFISLSIVVGAAAVIELFFRDTFPQPLWNLLFTATMALSLGLPVAIYSEKLYGASFLRDLISNPVGCLLATCIATYPNFVLHEFPNIIARQWVYTIPAGTFVDTMMLGIPLLIWLTWSFLTIISVSFFYLFASNN